jgi:hypothetical protein
VTLSIDLLLTGIPMDSDAMVELHLLLLEYSYAIKLWGMRYQYAMRKKKVSYVVSHQNVMSILHQFRSIAGFELAVPQLRPLFERCKALPFLAAILETDDVHTLKLAVPFLSIVEASM